MKLLNMEPIEGEAEVLATCTTICGRTVMFKGSVTIWHHWPSYRRCSTAREYWLAEEYQKYINRKRDAALQKYHFFRG